MLPSLRPHATTAEAYEPQTHTWSEPVDGEGDGTERGRIRAALGTVEPRDVVANLYGCDSWDAFEIRLREVPEGDPFVAAWDAIETGDAAALSRVLETDRGVIAARGPDGVTLLDHAIWKTDHGDWSWPPGPGEEAAERLELVRQLLDAGLDPDRANLDAWAPIHSAAYIGWPPTVELLLERGARVDRSTKGDGGTPLVLALFWGHREVAERLAEEGLHPLNLRVAAGLGRADLLVNAGGAHRAFYRPHPGFPRWQPSDDEQEIRDEALIWACRNGRLEVLDPIGGDVDAEVAGTTPLLTAASHGRTEAVRWLLDHGADVRGTASHWPGATPLHAAAWFDHLDTVRLLVERGARTDVRDDQHGGTPAGWAEYHGNTAVARWLAESA